jgi:acetoin utilization deacetylase AcuC-like enzyme
MAATAGALKKKGRVVQMSAKRTVHFHEDFYRVYTSDPAAAAGRMEAVVKVIRSKVNLVEAEHASEMDIASVHTPDHMAWVRQRGLFDIAALAAGATIQSALTGMTDPSFALVRPPGHHASTGSAWGFCYFNNMAIALSHLKRNGHISTALVLDFDLHFGDGTVNILGDKDWVTILNPEAGQRDRYLAQVRQTLETSKADIVGVSAGFDNHIRDWGGLLTTEDYHQMGTMVRLASERQGGGCFGVLEGGYNHDVLGHNVLAFIEGLTGAEWSGAAQS